MAYRCLYCGEYFSQSGAEEHFGKTRIEYNEGRLISLDATFVEVVDDTPSMCSGYGVLPGGKKCNGCDDCNPEKGNIDDN
jgi:hypothetical protein